MNEPSTVIDDEPEIEEEITFVEWNLTMMKMSRKRNRKFLDWKQVLVRIDFILYYNLNTI